SERRRKTPPIAGLSPRLCNTPKQRTGWWRMQSSETGLERSFSRITCQNRPSKRWPASVIANSVVIIGSYNGLQALSCYSAEQALETRNRRLEAQIRHLNAPNRDIIRLFGAELGILK